MKRILSLLLVVVMLLGTIPVGARAAEPTESNGAYQIGSADDLVWFAQKVNGGETEINAVLTANIDLSEISDWPGIGNQEHPFAGSFNGQDHTVTFSEAPWGLFGYVMGKSGAVAEIQNVRILGSVKQSAIASDAGYAHFTHCINGATIEASDSYVAGIVGSVSGSNNMGSIYSDVLLTNCGNEASISGFQNIGGLVGWTNANTRLIGCYNTGNIHGTNIVGGLVGYFQASTGDGLIQNSYNTGRVTGTDKVAGIVGHMMNSTKVENCYNAGSTTHAIAGCRYNSTAKITKCYFLGTASAKCSPDYTQTIYHGDITNEISTRATAMSGQEMADGSVAELLGDAFVQSCPTPVLAWQTAKEHTGDVCENCALGSTEKELYDVTFQQHDGYTLSGAAKATQDGTYTFTIAISEGYEAATGFAVKVNGTPVEADSSGTYAVSPVTGPLSVTVRNVQVIPGNHMISLPGEGYGYRITGDKTVQRDAPYTFTISFLEGFGKGEDFKVIAQEILSQSELDNGTVPTESTLTGDNGTYTIPAVQKDYRILVSGVKVESTVPPVKVRFTVTEGKNDFHVTALNEIIMDRELTVPYFDLSLYGLEKYYYNPYCYEDEAGNPKYIQEKGTPESAHNNITVMHALIAATELYYLGYRESQIGTGASCGKGFEEAISWAQEAGSSFMYLWDHGENLNYYVNYKYPLARPAWGSTSDQIVLQDDDIISLHMITGAGSGSDFGFFVANNNDNKFEYDTDTVDRITVDQGEKVKLTYFKTVTAGNYTTSYKRQGNQQLYWINDDDFDYTASDVTQWNVTEDEEGGKTIQPLGPNTLVTDSNGVVTIYTAELEPGIYHIGAPGGFTSGGGKDEDGFESKGTEAGAAYFCLEVQEYNGKTGDVDGDTQITSTDALMVQRYVTKLDSEIDVVSADVDGDCEITSTDALLIQRYVTKLITGFSEENP